MMNVLPAKGNLKGRRKWVVIGLLALPTLIMVGKLSAFPTSDLLTRLVSLSHIAVQMESRVRYVLFVPMGAVLVVFFRLTLGIRLLGPFRAILLAVAFQITGILFGLAFVGLVIGVIVFGRPFIERFRLPYYGRVSVILGIVSLIMTVTLLASDWLQAEPLRRGAYFPIVVLCLMGEAFARTLGQEGFRLAMWRGAMTVVVAALITGASMIPNVVNLLLRNPEILILQIGLIVLIAEFLDLRLFEGLNPPPKRKKRKRKKGRRGSAKRRKKTPAVPVYAGSDSSAAGRSQWDPTLGPPVRWREPIEAIRGNGGCGTEPERARAESERGSMRK